MQVQQPNKWAETRVLKGGKEFWDWILAAKNHPYNFVQNPKDPSDEHEPDQYNREENVND